LVSIYKVVRFGRGNGADAVFRLKKDLGFRQTFEPEIRHELDTEQEEEGFIKKQRLETQ